MSNDQIATESALKTFSVKRTTTLKKKSSINSNRKIAELLRNSLNETIENKIEYLIALLSIPVDERSQKDLKKIINFFDEKLTLRLFIDEKAQELDGESIKECFSKYMEIRFLNANENLFYIDDPADKFYLILKGNVRVFIPEKKIKPITNLEYYKFLEKLYFENECNLVKIIINENLIYAINIQERRKGKNNKNIFYKNLLSKKSQINEFPNNEEDDYSNISRNRSNDIKKNSARDFEKYEIMEYNSLLSSSSRLLKKQRNSNNSITFINNGKKDNFENSIPDGNKFDEKKKFIKLQEFESFEDFVLYCKIKYKKEIMKNINEITSQLELVDFYEKERHKISKFLELNLKFQDLDFFVKESPQITLLIKNNNQHQLKNNLLNNDSGNNKTKSRNCSKKNLYENITKTFNNSHLEKSFTSHFSNHDKSRNKHVVENYNSEDKRNNATHGSEKFLNIPNFSNLIQNIQFNSLNSNHQVNLTYNSSNNQNQKICGVSLEAKESFEKLNSNKSLIGKDTCKRVSKPNLLNIYINTNTNESQANSYNNFSNTASSKCLNFNFKNSNKNDNINKEHKNLYIKDNSRIQTPIQNLNSTHKNHDNIQNNNKYCINIHNKSNTQTLLSQDTNTEKSLNSSETYFINIKNCLEKKENVYIDPTLKFKTLARFNLTESEKLLEQRYNFFEEENINQEKILIEYKLKTLNQNFYFGDLALDSTKKKRTATVKGGEEDTILGFIPKDIYHYYIYFKKQQILQHNIHILNDLTIFKSIKSSTFQKFYFPLFEMFEYTKNEVILEPNAEVNNILILKSGKVEVSFKANIFEIQNLSKSIIDKLRKLNIINDDIFQKYEKEFIKNVSFKEFEMNRQKAEKLESNIKHVHLFNMSTGEILGLEPFMLGTKTLFKTNTQSEKVKLFSLNLENLKKIIRLYPECKENLIKITLSKTNAILKRLNTVKVSFLKTFEDHYKQNLEYLKENEKNHTESLNNSNLFKSNKCLNNNYINFQSRKNNKNNSAKLFKESEIVCESKIQMEKKFFKKILEYNEIENKKSQEFRIFVKKRDKLNIGKFWKSQNKNQESTSLKKNNNSSINNKSVNFKNTNLQGLPESEKQKLSKQKNFHNNLVNLEDNVLEIMHDDYYKNNLDESAKYIVNSPINISPYVVDNLIDENLDSSNVKSNNSFNKNYKKNFSKSKLYIKNVFHKEICGETSLHSDLQEYSNINVKNDIKDTKEENRENEDNCENKEDKENEDKTNVENNKNKENKEVFEHEEKSKNNNDSILIEDKIDNKKDSVGNKREEYIEQIKEQKIQLIEEQKNEKNQETIKNELILIEENSLIPSNTNQIQVKTNKETSFIKQINKNNCQSNFVIEKNNNSPIKNNKTYEKNDPYEFSFKKTVIENKTSNKIINNNVNSLNDQKIPNTIEVSKKDAMISTQSDNKFYNLNKQNISKEKFIFGECSHENSKIEMNTNSKNTFSNLSKKDEKTEEMNIKEIFQLNENQESFKKIMLNVNNSHNNLDSTTSNFEAISPLGFHRNFNRLEKSFRNETKNENKKSTLSLLFNINNKNNNIKANKKFFKNERFKISDVDRKTFYSSYNDTKKNGFSVRKNNILNKFLYKDLEQKNEQNQNSTNLIRKHKFTHSAIDLNNFNLDSTKNYINNTNSFTNDSKSIINNIVPVENKGYENKRINHMKVFVNKKNKIRKKNFNYSVENGRSSENGILEKIYISEKKNLNEIKSCSKNSVYFDENIDNNNSCLINPRKSNNSLKNYSLDCNNVKIQNVVLSPGIKFMGKKYENMTDQEKVDEIISKHHNSYEMQLLKNNNFAGDTLYYNNDIPYSDTKLINYNNQNNKKFNFENFINKQNPKEFFRSFYNHREQNMNNVNFKQNFYNTSRNFYGNFDKEKQNLSSNNKNCSIIKDFNVSNNNISNIDTVKINVIHPDDKKSNFNKNPKINILKGNGVESNFDNIKQKDLNEIVEEKYNSEKSINIINDKNNQKSEQVILSNKKNLKNNQENDIGLFNPSEDEDLKYNEEEILKENDFINNNSNKKLKNIINDSNTKDLQSSDFFSKKIDFKKCNLNKSKSFINNHIESYDIKSSSNTMNIIKNANYHNGLYSRSKSMAFDADLISEITNNNFFNNHPNKFMFSTMNNFRKTNEIINHTNNYGNLNINPNIISDNNRENFIIPNPNFLNSAYTNFYGTTNINQFISSGNFKSNSRNLNCEKKEILSAENDTNHFDNNKNIIYKNNSLLNNEIGNFSLLNNLHNNNKSINQLPIIVDAKDDLINLKNVNFKNLNNINVISNFMIDKQKNKGVSKNIHEMRNRNHEIKLRKLYNMTKNKL